MGKVRIISREEEAFADRAEAGRLLAHHLEELRGQHAVVLGIPRGGLVIAAEVARVIEGEVDIALARKLRAPFNPELAIGAMSEDGHVFSDPSLLRYLGITEDRLEQERARVQVEIEERQKLYRQAADKIPLKGRTVVITDDGLATGATMKAALWAARKEDPAVLICAVPVGAESTVHEVAELCDEMICLRVPAFFAAVGQFYRQFTQVADQEVLQVLRQARSGVGVT